MPRCQAGMLSISRAMKQSGVMHRKHPPSRTAQLQGPSRLINPDDQHVCVAYLVCGSAHLHNKAFVVTASTFRDELIFEASSLFV